MRLLVCGNRTWGVVQDRSREGLLLAARECGIVWRELIELRPKVILHGASKGADSIAAEWALSHGITTVPFRADWRKHPDAAGPIRNARMLKEGEPDRGVAFGALWRPEVSAQFSFVELGARWRHTGTGDMVKKMLDVGLPVRWVRSADGEAEAEDLICMPEPPR